MKKRLLSLALCLVMVFSLLPMGSLAIERPGEGYVAITNPTDWTPLSDYNGTSYGGDTNEVYALYNGEYYPVQFETGTLYEDAGAGWQAHEVAGYGQTLYYKNSSAYTATSTSRETWYQNLGNNVQIYGNFTKNANVAFWTIQLISARESAGGIDNSGNPIYVYTRKSTGEPFWHVVYCHNHGVLGGYYCTLYYYTQSETATLTANQIRTTNILGNTNGYESTTWNNAINKGTIVKIGNDGQYAWAWGDETLTIVGDTAYTGGEMYIPKGQSPYANKLSVGSSVLAWPAPGSQYSDEYSGHLYKRLTNQKVKMYIDVPGEGKVYPLTDGVALTAVETTDLLFRGTLYYHSSHVPLPSPTPTSIITTDETGDDGVYTHKDLTANGDAYDITLTAYTTGNEVTESQTTITPTVNPMDIVMVIDQSGSMATRDMGDSYAADSRTSWTVEQATSGQTHYVKVGNNYYPVQADTGYLYEEMETAPRGSDMIGWGDDGITLGVNGAPTFYNIKTDYYVLYNGEMHRLYLITAGLFLNYGLYPYIYVDNNDGYAKANKWEGHNYWVAVFDPWDGSDLRDNSTWNTLATNNRIAYVESDDGSVLSSSDYHADRARLSYSWVTSSARINGLYKLSDKKAANQLYYVDSAGVRHNLGTQATFSDSVVYQNEQGPLYVGNSTSRLDALKDAVTQFANTVQQNANEFGVDHRMAFVGFAGNKVPAYSLGSNAVTVGSNGLKDYTNTGLFNSGNLAFENYERITGYTSTSDNYINRHYYRNNGGTLLRYIDGAWYTVDLNNGAKVRSYSGSWSKADYEGNGTSLSAADYRSALLNVNENDAVNGKITSAINSFGANGGTYTSYGMTMAEQLFESIPVSDRQAQNSEGQTVDRQRVIIVFTDGEPGGNGYESSIAGEALVSGNLAKTDQGALVYTVGLFKGTPSSQVSDFMKKLSSEYSMNLEPVYGGQDNANYSLGQLDPNKTYYYQNADTGKYYALTTEYGNGNSLGWWVYNGSRNGNTTSYSLTNAKTSTGAGTTVFYNANGGQVQGDNVRPGTTYYTANGDKIVYEYRWFDSDRSVINPMRSADDNGSVGEGRVQFFELTSASANDDGFSYYMTAANQAELNNVFVQIADSIIQTETTVANNSRFTEDTLYVMDEISADFDLPANLSAENNHVKVYADTVAEWNTDGSPKTYDLSTTELRQGDEAAIAAGTADVKVTWEGKKLKVEYFDFGRMYMQESNPNAARIRVVIDGITPNKAGEKLYSNTAQSGLYYKDPVSGAVTMVEDFNRPFISVPGYTVKWVDDQGTNMANPYDQDTDLIKGNVPVYDGGEPTKDSVVEENVSRTDYTFDGWSTTPGGDKVISITRDAESGVVTSFGTFPAVVDSGVTYYAHFSSEVKTFYTATWFNGADQLFEQKGLASGDVPAYAGEMPTKDADADYTYFFAGWHADSRYDADDTLPYQQKYTAEYLEQQGVITQLPEITDHDVTFYAVFAPVQIGTEVYVMEYGTKNIIRESGVYGFDAMYTPGGEFGQDKAEGAAVGNFYFVPMLSGNSQYATEKNVYDMTGFSKVNTGVFYEGENNTAPTKVNVIPGSSVYFDDSLKSVSASVNDPDAATKTYNYEAALEGVNAGEDDTESIAKNTTLTFKFTGTRIDVYCTTEEGSKSVKASILDEEGNLVGNLTGIVNNHADHTRYNVPTVSFVMPEYGTYTLQLRNINATYKLDGVRVYNPLEDDSVYEESEQNAIFLNLRSKLVTGLKAELDAYAKAMEDYEAGTITVEPVAPEAVAFYNEKGSASTADYITNSPKNEIYLAPGEKVAFAIKGFSTYTTPPTVMIGLSNQDGSEGKATVNGEEKQLKAVTDSYYTVNMAKTGQTGYVVIENTGDKNISLTNLRISGVSTADIERANSTTAAASVMSVNETSRKAVVEPKLIVTKKLTSFVENPEYVEAEPDPTPDPTEQPTHQPTLQELIRQLLSEFVRNLFGSIGRLFGN